MRSGYLQRAVNPITTSIAVCSSLKTAHFAASSPLFSLGFEGYSTPVFATTDTLFPRILKMIEMGKIKDRCAIRLEINQQSSCLPRLFFFVDISRLMVVHLADLTNT